MAHITDTGGSRGTTINTVTNW